MNKNRLLSSLLMGALFVVIVNHIMIAYAQDGKNTTSEYEKQLKEKIAAAEKLTREQLDTLYNTANSTDSADKRNIKGFVLSTDVMSFDDIPRKIDNDIAILKEKIRYIILQVATDIENYGDINTGRLNVGNSGISYELPADAKKEFKDFMEGKEKNNISIRSVQVAMKIFAYVNKQLMEQAKNTNNIQEKKKYYIMQAVYVYELSDIVLDVLNKASLNGREAIEKIKDENEKRISERINRMDSELINIKEEKTKGKITDDEAMSYEKLYSNLISANKESLKGWNDIMRKIGSQEDWLLKMKNYTTSILFKKNAAKNQLDTLRDVAVVSELLSMVGDMDELVSIVQQIPLLELDPATVQELLFGKPIINDEKKVKPIIIN